MKCKNKLLALSVSVVAIGAALIATKASAQSVPNFATNRAQVIGEMTDESLAQVLREGGKLQNKPVKQPKILARQ